MLRPVQDKRLVELLRKEGKSYLQIKNLTNISKSTLSNWLSKEDWSIKIKSELFKKSIKDYKVNQLKAVEANKRIKKLRDKETIEEAQSTYHLFKNESLFAFGLGIYWGEGSKRSTGLICVTNTDPNLLKIAAGFYRKYLKVDEKKLKVSLYLYETLNKEKAIIFWSKLLNVPINQFITIRIVKNNENNPRKRKIRYKYGVCSLYFSNTKLHIKILEWIRLLSLDLAGVVQR